MWSLVVSIVAGIDVCMWRMYCIVEGADVVGFVLSWSSLLSPGWTSCNFDLKIKSFFDESIRGSIQCQHKYVVIK